MIEFNGDERVTIKGFAILLVLWNTMIVAGAVEASNKSNGAIDLTLLNFDDELSKKALMVMFYSPE